MNSTVRSRPHHYEVLGVAGDASTAEIERAFLVKVSLLNPHAFGQITEASVAYQVLKDPARRRAFDRSIGIGGVEPADPPLCSGRTWSMRASPTQPLAFDFAATTDEQKREGSNKPDSPPERPLTPLAEREASTPRPEPFQLLELAEVEESDDSGRRTMIVAAGIIAAVGIGGALLGRSAGSDPNSHGANSVTVAAPAPQPVQPASIPVNEPLSLPGEAVEAKRIKRVPKRAAALTPVPAPQAHAVPSVASAALSSSPPSLTDEVQPGAPIAVEPAPPKAMPLSNRTIARTIERIGYPCGSVASTAGGGGGVFTVTCTSGHSYRAAPVGGRYRFKRQSG